MRFSFWLPRRRDFTTMGRGIAARYQRCAEYWRPHLDLTREFVAAAARPSKRVAVLGAGRLLDLDLPRLLEVTDEVHLFDADSECARWWKRNFRRRYGGRIIARVTDVTSTMDEWTSRLPSSRVRTGIDEYLNELRAPVPAWAREEFDGVVSLNVLGQLPLYWRDRVLARHPRLTGNAGTSLERAMGELQSAHVRAVEGMETAWRVLVTDTEYYYYRSSVVEWSVESAVFAEAGAALGRLASKSSLTDRWLWHLAPQYIERDDYGEIHRVEAYSLPPAHSAR